MAVTTTQTGTAMTTAKLLPLNCGGDSSIRSVETIREIGKAKGMTLEIDNRSEMSPTIASCRPIRCN